MNRFKTLIFSLIIFMFSLSIGFANDVIGVISAGIGDITNQQKIDFERENLYSRLSD